LPVEVQPEKNSIITAKIAPTDRNPDFASELDLFVFNIIFLQSLEASNNAGCKIVLKHRSACRTLQQLYISTMVTAGVKRFGQGTIC